MNLVGVGLKLFLFWIGLKMIVVMCFGLMLVLNSILIVLIELVVVMLCSVFGYGVWNMLFGNGLKFSLYGVILLVSVMFIIVWLWKLFENVIMFGWLVVVCVILIVFLMVLVLVVKNVVFFGKLFGVWLLIFFVSLMYDVYGMIW